MTRSVRLLAGLVMASTVWASAQEVVFRTAVDLVTVDAIVLGGDGRPVAGLTADDFTVEVDGRPRPVASVQFIAQAQRDSHERALPASHFTTNEQGDAGRYLVVAVDEAHIRRLEGGAALRGAANFVDSLDPLDHVAVVGLSRLGIVQFTRDRQEARRRLATLTGHTDPVFLQFNIGLLEAVELADGNRTRLADVVLRECGRSLTEYTSLARATDDAVGRDACPEQVEQEARVVAQHARTQARISLASLGTLVATLKPIDGPKTIVLLSEGMVVDPRLVDLGQLAAAARDARVTIYALHMEAPLFEAAQDRVSPTLLQDLNVRGDGLSRVAGAARGTVFKLVGSDPRPFARVAEEISAYYLLGVEPIEADRDGGVHRIDVRLKRSGTTVRARPAFRLPPVVPSPRMREEDLVALLRSARPATELPVRVATFVYAEPAAPDVRVVVSVEADAASGPAADVLLGYVLVDSRGVIAASGAHRVQSGRKSFSTRLPAGNYTLRVGGIDPFGRRGIVQRAFRAMVLPQNGVRLSDLIVAPAAADEAAPLDPIVDRTAEASLTSYLEIYGDGSQLPRLSARFELVAADATTPLRRFDTPVQEHGTRWAAARATLSLGDLPPGPYVVVVRLMNGDREIARAARPFTYAPAPP